MADYVEKWGDDIESAVELALKDIKLTRDEVEIEVLEQPTRGFFGLHKKLAKVRVTKKEKPVIEKVREPEISRTEKNKEASSHDSKAAKKEERSRNNNRFKRAEVIKEVQPDPSVENKEQADKEKITVEAADSNKNKNNHRSKNNRKERRENGGRKIPKENLINTKFSVTSEDTNAVPANDAPAVIFIKNIAEKMGITIKVKGDIIDEVLYIDMSGKEVGTLIGKRGQTLDSVQYLASIVQNKKSEEHIRVIVNAENYREKREKTLQQLAKKVADKCVKNGRNQKLEPMNPYERKIIHSTLQSHPKVTTRSEGVEPTRRVVVELKR